MTELQNNIAREIAEDISVIVAFAINTTATGNDDKILEHIKAAVNSIELNPEPSSAKAVESLLSIFGVIAEKTPTPVDNRIVKLANILVDVFGLEGEKTPILGRIKARRKARRALRA